MALYNFQRLQRLCPSVIANYNPQESTVKVTNGAFVPTFRTFKGEFSIAREKLLYS